MFVLCRSAACVLRAGVCERACSFAAVVSADLSARRAVCCCSSVTNDTRLQRYTTDNSPDGELRRAVSLVLPFAKLTFDPSRQPQVALRIHRQDSIGTRRFATRI